MMYRLVMTGYIFALVCTAILSAACGRSPMTKETPRTKKNPRPQKTPNPQKNPSNSHHRETAVILTQYRCGNLAVFAPIADLFSAHRTAQGVKAGLYNTGRHVRT